MTSLRPKNAAEGQFLAANYLDDEDLLVTPKSLQNDDASGRENAATHFPLARTNSKRCLVNNGNNLEHSRPFSTAENRSFVTVPSVVSQPKSASNLTIQTTIQLKHFGKQEMFCSTPVASFATLRKRPKTASSARHHEIVLNQSSLPFLRTGSNGSEMHLSSMRLNVSPFADNPSAELRYRNPSSVDDEANEDLVFSAAALNLSVKQMADKSAKLNNSFWSEFKKDYRLLMKDGYLMDGCQDISTDLRDAAAKEKLQTLMELFREQCSLLHRDICDNGFNQSDLFEDDSEILRLRLNQLTQQADALLENFLAAVGDEVVNRMKLVRSVFDQMATSRRNQQLVGDDSGAFGRLVQLRKWLQQTEMRIGFLEQENESMNWNDSENLRRVLEDYKQIQQDVQKDGSQLVNSLSKLLAAGDLQDEGKENSNSGQLCQPFSPRKRIEFHALERRWHTLCLHTLECQLWVEEQVQKIEAGLFVISDSDSDVNEPLAKRSRTYPQDVDDDESYDFEDELTNFNSDSEASLCCDFDYDANGRDEATFENSTDFAFYERRTTTAPDFARLPRLNFGANCESRSVDFLQQTNRGGGDESDSDVSDVIPFAAGEYEKIVGSSAAICSASVTPTDSCANLELPDASMDFVDISGPRLAVLADVTNSCSEDSSDSSLEYSNTLGQGIRHKASGGKIASALPEKDSLSSSNATAGLKLKTSALPNDNGYASANSAHLSSNEEASVSPSLSAADDTSVGENATQSIGTSPLKIYYQMTPADLLDSINNNTDTETTPRTVFTTSSGVGSSVATASVSYESLNAADQNGNVRNSASPSSRNDAVASNGVSPIESLTPPKDALPKTNSGVASPTDFARCSATMTDSLTVNIGDSVYEPNSTRDLQEVLELLDQSAIDYNTSSSWQQRQPTFPGLQDCNGFNAQLQSMLNEAGSGTTWRPLKDKVAANRSSPQKRSSLSSNNNNGSLNASANEAVANASLPILLKASNANAAAVSSSTPKSGSQRKAHNLACFKLISSADANAPTRRVPSSCDASSELSCDDSNCSEFGGRDHGRSAKYNPYGMRKENGGLHSRRCQTMPQKPSDGGSCRILGHRWSHVFEDDLSTLSSSASVLRGCGSLKRRRRRRSERPLSLTTSIRLFETAAAATPKGADASKISANSAALLGTASSVQKFSFGKAPNLRNSEVACARQSTDAHTDSVSAAESERQQQWLPRMTNSLTLPAEMFASTNYNQENNSEEQRGILDAFDNRMTSSLSKHDFRRKLQACRKSHLPRSASDGEHLSCISLAKAPFACPFKQQQRGLERSQEPTMTSSVASAALSTSYANSSELDDRRSLERLPPAQPPPTPTAANFPSSEDEETELMQMMLMSEGGDDDGGMDDCNQEEEPESDGDGYRMGAGEAMIEDSPPPHSASQLPGGERMDGDGGSSSIATGVCPDQFSDCCVWEWDDYKPPAHSEFGAPDQPLDESRLIESFGGDDYRQFLESQSDSISILSSSNRRHLHAHSVSSADENCHRSPLRYKRLPPVGLSHDSDSDLEELFKTVKHSQKQLRYVQNTLKGHGECDSNGTRRNCEIGALINMCNSNIKRLQEVAGHLTLLSGTSANLKNPDYATVFKLLSDWQTQLSSLSALKCQQLNRIVMGRSDNQNAQSEEEDSSLKSSQPFEDYCSLQSEIRCLFRSLESMLQQGSLNRSFSSGQYESLEDLKRAVKLLKELQCQLDEKQKRLVRFVDFLQTSSTAQANDIKDELMQLCSFCDKAIETCNAQTTELEQVEETWQNWAEMTFSLRQLICGLESKLRLLEEWHSKTTTQSFAREQSGISEEQISSILRGVVSDIRLCEDRLKRVQRFSQTLNDNFGLISVDLNQECGDLARLIASIQQRLKLLPAAALDVEACRCHANEFDESAAVCSEHLLRRKRLLKHQLETAEQLPPANVNEPSPTDKSSGQRLTATGRRGAFTMLWRIIRSSWPLQLCLLCIIMLGAYIVQPLCCQNKNNWRSAFGPQLDHKRPPPS